MDWIDWQTLAVGAVALACGVYLARRVGREIRGRAGCGDCQKCGAPAPGAGLLQVMDDRLSEPSSPAIRSGRTTFPEAD